MTVDVGTPQADSVKDDVAFRAELRDFLSRCAPGEAPRGAAERLAWQRAWASTLVDEGFAAPSWPKEFGGMDLPLSQQVIYHEETGRVRLPAHPSPGTFVVGPTLIRHGTPDQQSTYLAAALRADTIWCQGFSEPDAGSDLPGLQTRAVRDGDCYVVTGQKLWVTNGPIADMMFALARTGSTEARADGISYLLVDMRSPGLEVRPLRDLAGGVHFSEVRLDEVRVPVTQRVGAEGEGWRIARTSLGHERATAGMTSTMRYRRIVDELLDLARTYGKADDPVVRQRLAQAEIRFRLIQLNGERVLASVLGGAEPGPAASISRLMFATFEQWLHEVAVDIIGPAAMLAAGAPFAPQRGRWTGGFLFTRAATIGAGTAEIQRNTIAEGVLGLPRDPGAL